MVLSKPSNAKAPNIALRCNGTRRTSGGPENSARSSKASSPPAIRLASNLFHKNRNRLDVRGVREHVERLEVIQAIGRVEQPPRVARQRGEVAGDIHDTEGVQ